MDTSTKRLLDSILSYCETAPPNVSNDLLKDLKGISERIIESSHADETPSPGRMAVASAMGEDEPQTPEYDPEDIDKSPGQREAEAAIAQD